MTMLKHNQNHQITVSLCSSGCYNSDKAAKQNLKLIMWGSRAQLKQTLITIMVTQNSGFHLQRYCLLTSGVFNNAPTSLNYSLISLTLTLLQHYPVTVCAACWHKKSCLKPKYQNLMT